MTAQDQTDPYVARKALNAAKTLSRTKKREKVLKALGGSCWCCGTKRLTFLMLKARRGVKNLKESRKAYTRVLYNLFPVKRDMVDILGLIRVRKAYMVLCRNCEGALRFYGKCKHRQGQKHTIAVPRVLATAVEDRSMTGPEA